MIENSFGFLGWKDMAQRKWVRNTIIKKHIMPTQRPSVDIEFCYQRKHLSSVKCTRSCGRHFLHTQHVGWTAVAPALCTCSLLNAPGEYLLHIRMWGHNYGYRVKDGGTAEEHNTLFFPPPLCVSMEMLGCQFFPLKRVSLHLPRGTPSCNFQ